MVDSGNERRCVEIFCQLMMKLMVGNEALAGAVFIAREALEKRPFESFGGWTAALGNLRLMDS